MKSVNTLTLIFFSQNICPYLSFFIYVGLPFMLPNPSQIFRAKKPKFTDVLH